jgi:hypothetical protein
VSEKDGWELLANQIQSLFGVQLEKPRYIAERGEIVMTYKERSGTRLDLSSNGRGLQQTLLLLAYLQANPGAVLLLDEPDAHLEILRQRQIYQLLTEVAAKHGSQIIAASHSEVILNEAADRDVVVAFVGQPHRIDDRGSQVLEALSNIGFDQYYQAEQQGWVLYLEGSTDLAILRAFARVLQHAGAERLERPFVHYVQNQPQKVREHFYGLREAKPDLVGIAVLDRLDQSPDSTNELQFQMWQQREIENYLCQRPVLLKYAAASAEADNPGPLFSQAHVAERTKIMHGCIEEMEKAMQSLEKGSPWSPDAKVSENFLDPLFKAYFRRLKLPNLMSKTGFHQLASFVTEEDLSAEVREKLDAIADVARKASPRT